MHQDWSWGGYADSGSLGLERNRQTMLFVYPQITFVRSLLLFVCRSSEVGRHKAVISLRRKGTWYLQQHRYLSTVRAWFIC